VSQFDSIGIHHRQQQQRIIPSLMTSSSLSSKTVKKTYRKEIVAAINSKNRSTEERAKQKIDLNNSSTTKSRLTTMTSSGSCDTRNISGTKERNSQKKVDTVNHSSATGKHLRASRIPSPTIINPDAGQLLPRRNTSPLIRSTSPEKKSKILPPRRFRLPKVQPLRPQQKSDSVTTEEAKISTRDKSNKHITRPNQISSRIEKRTTKAVDPPSSKSTRYNSLNSKLQADAEATIRNNLPNMKSLGEKSNSQITIQPPANSSPKIENELSAYLMDSCSITEASLIPGNQYIQHPEDTDSVMKSHSSSESIEMNIKTKRKYLSETSFLQLKGNQINFKDEQLGKKMNSWSARGRNVSNGEIEQYRSSPDENDAKNLNVTPRPPVKAYQTAQSKKPFTRQTHNLSEMNGNNLSPIDLTNYELPQGEGKCQAIDAACLQSGDYIMLQSCNISATVRANCNVLAEINGPGLGKDEELLKVVKIEDESFAALRYGDVVVLMSSMTQKNMKALGVRKKRNDVNGIYEIGFFDVGDKKSDRWVILSAKPGRSVVVGRGAAVMEKIKTPNHMSGVATPVRNGNSILLLNCFNGGLLSIKDGVAVLITDSYDPDRMPNSDNPSLLGRLEHLDRLKPSVSETFQLVKSFIPPCPSWIMSQGMGERLFLTGSYLSEPLRNLSSAECEGKLFEGSLQTTIPFNDLQDITIDRNLSLKSKEKILVDEVIGSFLGLEGVFIRLKKSEEESTQNSRLGFQLFDTSGITFDLSLRNLVDQILPLSTSYLCVRNFASSHYPGYEYGRVMQAFCEGLDLFLQQFVDFVAQLECKIRKPLTIEPCTMKTIHFEITPLLHSMSVLEHTTNVVCNKKGGALINALRSLEKRVYMGDTVAKDLLGTLLDQASVPYAEMLSIWLQSGRLYDPYEEFMVNKSADGKNATELDGNTWTALFTINDEHVVKDIIRNEKSKNMILVTGKYWNAVQLCDTDVKSSQERRSQPLELKKLQFQSDMSAISAYIDSMYQSASENLIQILRDKFHLKESLCIMKRYFLLEQGDFLVDFLEAAEEELAKPFEEVSIGRVQHFLGTSIQTTEAQREAEIYPSDSFHRKYAAGLNPTSLRCRLSKQSLVSNLSPTNRGMTGIELFEIDFPRVPFPISLIISRSSMEEYKLLFRHLFFVKHVERRLVGVWSDHQVLKKLDSVRGLLGPTFLMRQRMLHFVQNFINYMTIEVVESNWLEMLSSIDAPKDTFSNQKEQMVDDLLNIHDGFLQKTVDACLLRNPVFIKSLMKLLNTCLLFTDQMKRFMDTTRIYDDSINLAAEKRGAVQRNLNERASLLSSTAPDKKKIRRTLMSMKEERDILRQRQTRRVGREICSESYKRMIRRFEEVFNADLSAFMIQLNTQTTSEIIAKIGKRLDWNSFLSNRYSKS